MSALRKFMETAELVFVQLGPSGVVKACNPYLAALTGWSREDIVGANWFRMFLPPEICDQLAGHLRTAFEARETYLPQNFENEILTRSGDRLTIAWNNAMAFGPDGAATSVESVGVDITEGRRLQRVLEATARQAEEANASKSRYLAHMSHELRTPLNSIIGFSEIMREQLFGPMPESYREYSELVHRSALHLHRLIDDVLDIAKIEANKLELSLVETGLGQIVNDSMALAAGQALDYRVVLRRVDHRNPRIRVDALRAEQAVLNILSNAIKFAPKTTVTIGLRSDADGHHVEISDRGIGMTPDELTRVLQPFAQVMAGETRRRGAGSGLGLPLAKSLMELHGGRLAISSHPGIGTTVTLTFPLPKV